MNHLRQTLLIVVLVGMVAGGCATSRAVARPAIHRTPDSAAERLAGLREAEPETKAAATEERFSAEADRQRREEARAAKAERQRRVDVVEPTKKAGKK